MKDIAALYFSPRVKGNSDLLLDEFLRGASEAGVGAKRIYARKLNVQACTECGGCDETGECVLRDDMDELYSILIEAEKVVVVVPIFFYGLPSDGKAIVDRSQALWNRVRLKPELKRPHGRGFFLGIGATRGQNLFEGPTLTIKYFCDALGLPLQIDTLTFRRVEAKGAIKEHPTAMADAFAAGKKFAEE